MNASHAMMDESPENAVPAIVNDSQTTTYTTDFQIRNNLILVETRIDGVCKLLILDTGASATVLRPETADELGLEEVQTVTGQGAGRRMEGAMVKVQSLAVAGATVYPKACVVMNLTDVCSQLGDDIAGVLGYDFLSKFKLTIDYQARQLNLESLPPAVNRTDAVPTGDFG